MRQIRESRCGCTPPFVRRFQPSPNQVQYCDSEAEYSVVSASVRLYECEPQQRIGRCTKYPDFQALPNSALVALFHACIDNTDAPQQWLVTLLIGILKQGRPVDDPESYRLVGLECCLLKVLTLLLDGRLREWAAANNIIPDSQNGFQQNHRTDDNSFILLSAIHRARAEGKTLYVFFGDMTNAFPYTDIARLWSEMYAAGPQGSPDRFST